MVAQPQTQMGAAEFKAHCLKLLKNINQTEVIITKHGHPVAKLIPYTEEKIVPRHKIFGCMAGTFEIVGDIMAPLEDLETWEEQAIASWDEVMNELMNEPDNP